MTETTRMPRVLVTLDEVGEISFASTYMGTKRSKFIRSKDFSHRGEIIRITVLAHLDKTGSDSGTFRVQVISLTQGRALLNHEIDEAVRIDEGGLIKAVQTAWREYLTSVSTSEL